MDLDPTTSNATSESAEAEIITDATLYPTIHAAAASAETPAEREVEEEDGIDAAPADHRHPPDATGRKSLTESLSGISPALDRLNTYRNDPLQALRDIVDANAEAAKAPRTWPERLERPFGCLVGVGVAFAWARFAGVDLDRPLESVSSLALAYSMGRALGHGLYPVNLRDEETPGPVGIVVSGAWNFIWFFGAASVANWCWGVFANLFRNIFATELPFMVSHNQLLSATILIDVAGELVSVI